MDPGAPKRPSAAQENQFRLTQAGFQDAIHAATGGLEKDIRAANKTLSGKRLTNYLRDAKDTQGVLNGMGKIVEYADYGVLAARVVKEEGLARDEATGELTLRFAADVSKYGMTAAAKRFLPARLATLFLGPVGWAAGVAWDVVTPVRTNLDFSEVIRDRQASIAEKQEALQMMWRAYETYGDHWGPAQRQELLALTETVYREAATPGTGARAQ